MATNAPTVIVVLTRPQHPAEEIEMDQLDDMGPDGGFPGMGPPPIDGPGALPDFGYDNPIGVIDHNPVDVIDDNPVGVIDHDPGIAGEEPVVDPIGDNGPIGATPVAET